MLGLEFAYEQALPGTKSFVTSVFFLTIYGGDQLGSIYADMYQNPLTPSGCSAPDHPVGGLHGPSVRRPPLRAGRHGAPGRRSGRLSESMPPRRRLLLASLMVSGRSARSPEPRTLARESSGAPAVTASPAGTRAVPTALRPARAPALPGSPFWLSFKFYQQVVSPIDGPQCIHRPTCSLFALQAIHKHPLLGPFFALDRLWRGADSSAIRRLDEGVTPEGFPYFKDPLELNDFWLR